MVESNLRRKGATDIEEGKTPVGHSCWCSCLWTSLWMQWNQLEQRVRPSLSYALPIRGAFEQPFVCYYLTRCSPTAELNSVTLYSVGAVVTLFQLRQQHIMLMKLKCGTDIEQTRLVLWTKQPYSLYADCSFIHFFWEVNADELWPKPSFALA